MDPVVVGVVRSREAGHDRQLAVAGFGGAPRSQARAGVVGRPHPVPVLLARIGGIIVIGRGVRGGLADAGRVGGVGGLAAEDGIGGFARQIGPRQRHPVDVNAVRGGQVLHRRQRPVAAVAGAGVAAVGVGGLHPVPLQIPGTVVMSSNWNGAPVLV
jgi:hypothetical protein